MADATLKVGIQTEFQAAGAQQAQQALDGVKQKADEAGNSVKRASDSIADLGAKAGPAAPNVAELSKVTTVLGVEMDKNTPSFGRVKEGIEGINIAARGGPQALIGLSKAIESLEGKLKGLPTLLASVGGAFSGGFAVGTLIYKQIVDPIWDAFDAVKNEASIFSKEVGTRLSSMNEVKVEFTGIRDGVRALSDDIDAVVKQMDAAQKRESLVQDAKSSLAAKEMAVQRQQAIAGAGGNKDLEAVINAEFDAREAVAQTVSRQTDIQRKIEVTSAKIEAKEKESESITSGIRTIRESIAKKLKAYEESLDIISAAGYDREAIKSPTGRDAAYQQAKEKAESAANIAENIGGARFQERADETKRVVTALEGLKKTQELYLQSQRQDNDELTKFAEQSAKNNDELADLRAELQAFKLGMKEVEADRQLAAGKEGASMANAMGSLERAIRESESRVSQARSNLASAHGSGGQGEQTSAAASLQSEEQYLAKLREALATAKRSLSEGGQILGQAYIDSAAQVKTDATTAKTEVKAAANAASTGLNDASKEVQGATSALVSETNASTGKIAGAISEMGSQINALGSTVASSMSGIVSSIDRIQSQLSAISGRVDTAQRSADIALAQNRNRV